MTFDRLLYIDTLKDGGVDETVARAHAEGLRMSLQESVATKADLQDLSASIDARFNAVDRRFDALEAKFESKIELSARDLTIKGAGGLIIIAGLIVGLKLFG